LKLSVPVPLPNATFAVLSVPGAAGGLLAAAPIFSVPTDPAFAATTIGPPLVTVPPSATVSVPVPKLPMLTPELLLQVEPAPVTVTVPCEPAPLPMLAVGGGVIDDHPTVRDRECARAKTADIEPAAWTVVPTGARAGHCHGTGRTDRQSDGAAAGTVHRTAVLDGKRARAQAADHDGSDVRPRGTRAGYGHRALRAQQIANKAADIGQRSAVLDNEHSCPGLTDGKI
jgi:hypothetical protein